MSCPNVIHGLSLFEPKRRRRYIGRTAHSLIGAVEALLLLLVTVNLVLAADVDESFRGLLRSQGVGSLTLPTPASPAKIELGQMLYFDKHLSGNNNIACASCHHPSLSSADARSLPSGTGGDGLGPDRTAAAGHDPIPRNSPDVFERGQSEWTSMFWDSRVATVNGKFVTPAGPDLPAGIDTILAAQAMFPVTSRAEMRGFAGDTDALGNPNELANINDNDLPAIWQALMDRLRAVPEYNQLFEAAYPDIPTEQLGFQHAADAIAAFESAAFSIPDSAWDRYLAGDNNALTEPAKRGAHLFYGGAQCASCHGGNLMTDQQHHNLSVPQLGPGKDESTGLDPGRGLVTGNPDDNFSFRTPPLRNVAATGPWMHNGAYTNLEDAVRHHLDPAAAIASYDLQQLDPSLRATVRMDAETIAAIVSGVDPLLPVGLGLSDQDVNDLAAFLFSLTSPSLDTLPDLVPASVPSGLAVDRMPEGQVHVLYDKNTGELRVDGPEETELTSVMLRISDDLGEDSAGVSFLVNSATWSNDESIVLSDTDTAQSFLEWRKGAPFRVGPGDSLGNLLPPTLSMDLIEGHLSAYYMLNGSLALWQADVIYVPETSPVAIWALVGAIVCRRRGKTRRLWSRVCKSTR